MLPSRWIWYFLFPMAFRSRAKRFATSLHFPAGKITLLSLLPNNITNLVNSYGFLCKCVIIYEHYIILAYRPLWGGTLLRGMVFHSQRPVSPTRTAFPRKVVDSLINPKARQSPCTTNANRQPLHRRLSLLNITRFCKCRLLVEPLVNQLIMSLNTSDNLDAIF